MNPKANQVRVCLKSQNSLIGATAYKTSKGTPALIFFKILLLLWCRHINHVFNVFINILIFTTFMLHYLIFNVLYSIYQIHVNVILWEENKKKSENTIVKAFQNIYHQCRQLMSSLLEIAVIV